MFDPEQYCRELEAYLCRKNDGHLIRIAGPAFERVSSWAQQGVPLSVAREAVDRCFERYHRRGPRRRPLRIEFCEADVLDGFDVWRRAVGVARVDETKTRARASLAAHLERVGLHLDELTVSGALPASLQQTLKDVAGEVKRMAPSARGVRGAARDAALDRLAELERVVDEAIVAASDAAVRDEANAVAREQLAPFRDRMPAEALASSSRAAAARYLRQRYGLPTLLFP